MQVEEVGLEDWESDHQTENAEVCERQYQKSEVG